MKQLGPNEWLVEPKDIPDQELKKLERYPKAVLVVPGNLNNDWKDALVAAGYKPVGQCQINIDSVSTACAKWQKGRINDGKAFPVNDGWNQSKP